MSITPYGMIRLHIIFVFKLFQKLETLLGRASIVLVVSVTIAVIMSGTQFARRSLDGFRRTFGSGPKRSVGLLVVVTFAAVTGWSVIYLPQALAAAKTASYLSSHLPDAKNHVIGWENACTTTLNAERAANAGNRSAAQQRANVNAPGAAYNGDVWISKSGNPTSISGSYAPTARNIPLQLNRMYFLCSAVVNNPPRAPGSDYPVTANKVTSSRYPNDRGPVSDSSSSYINSASLYEINLSIVSATVSSGDGTIGGLVGQGLSIRRDNNSRYWNASPNGFTFDPSASLTPGKHTLRIQIGYKTMSTYHAYGSSGTTRCTYTDGTGHDITYLNYSRCKIYYETYSYTYTIAAPELECGNSQINPEIFDPYMPFDITVGVDSNARTLPADTQMTLNVDGSGYTYSRSQTPTVSGGDATATFLGVGPTNHTGVFKISWTLSSASGGFSISCGFNAGKTSEVVNVAYMPYLSVFGGDVQVGSSATDGHVCSTANTDAGAYSWNRNGVPSGNFSGAGAQYAVMALGQIQGFASSLGNGSNPARLSFSNTLSAGNEGGVDYSNDDAYGGGFGGSTADCDFTSDDTYDTTFPASSTVSGTKVVYVTGDLYINHNISYGTSWADLTQMPSFKVVVLGGNIYIDKSVNELDGLYVAEPTAAKPDAGIIFTCASSVGNEYKVDDPSFYTSCNRSLTVNGSFVARSVQFLRTRGSLGQAAMNDNYISSQAAEIFNYSPEMWLPRYNSPPSSKYDTITGLPPVL